MGRWAIVNGLLGLFVILLSVEIARIWSRALPEVEVVQRAAGDPTVASGAKPKAEGGKGRHGDRNQPAKGADASPATLVAVIVDRELFDPSRVKPTEDVKAQVKTAPVVNPPANVTVVGVRLLGKDREVFITENNQPRRLRIGDQVGGYTVKKIQPTEVTLASPTGDVVPMPLNVDKGKGGPPKPPGAPAVPGARPPGAPGAAVAASPAAGIIGQNSPAAGVQAKPAAAPAPPLRPGAPAAAGAPAQPQPSPLPADVKKKLEQLKDQRAQNRMGHK